MGTGRTEARATTPLAFAVPHPCRKCGGKDGAPASVVRVGRTKRWVLHPPGGLWFRHLLVAAVATVATRRISAAGAVGCGGSRQGQEQDCCKR